MTVKAFALLDRDLNLVEVDLAAGCVAQWRRVDDESDMPDDGAEIGDYLPDEIAIPPAAFAAYSNDDLARYRILSAEFPAAPEGQRLAGYALDLDDGDLVVVPTWEAIAPARREIPKSLVMARLTEAGVIGAAMAALMAAPELFAKWFAPDWPNVFADDGGLLAFLGEDGLDLTAEQIAAVTA